MLQPNRNVRYRQKVMSRFFCHTTLADKAEMQRAKIEKQNSLFKAMSHFKDSQEKVQGLRSALQAEKRANEAMVALKMQADEERVAQVGHELSPYTSKISASSQTNAGIGLDTTKLRNTDKRNNMGPTDIGTDTFPTIQEEVAKDSLKRLALRSIRLRLINGSTARAFRYIHECRVLSSYK